MAGKGAINQGSEMPTSQGGSFPGVKSGVCLNKGQFTKGSATVTVKGKPCEHLTSPTQQNGANANAPGGAQIAPSQVNVLVGF